MNIAPNKVDPNSPDNPPVKKYDVRELLRAAYYAIDKKPIKDAKLSFKEKQLLKLVLKKTKGTDIEILLKESGLI